MAAINTLTKHIYQFFPALKERNYQLYFAGQFISLIGTWLQTVAQGWLVLQLSNSAFWVGFVGAMGSLPTLFFTLFGGVLVDRFDKRKILVGTQISLTILATVFGLLTVFQAINLHLITLLAFLMGLVAAIDIPARQSFVIEMVGRENLASAIALNSGLFNAARVIGPTIAGFLIAYFGIGGAFIINGVSFIPVVIALILMNVPPYATKKLAHPLRAIKDGMIYAFGHPGIRVILFLAAISSIFGWPYTTIMPVVAKHVFGLDVKGLGYFYAATGLGAVTAAILVSGWSKKLKGFDAIMGGNLIFALSIIGFSFTKNIVIAHILLFISGLGLIGQFSYMNTIIQHLVNDEIRGRVMSIYALMFMGMTPFGSFQIGQVSEHFGPQIGIRISGCVVLLSALFLITKAKNIRPYLSE